MSIINFPVLYVPDPLKGRPLFSGQIYVGEPDLDPAVVVNQKQLNIVQEDGTVVPVSQPFALSAGGVPMYNGATVRLDVEGNYSLKILDRLGAQAYYVDNVFEGQPVLVSELPALVDTILINDLSQAYSFKTVALMKASAIVFPVGKKVTWKGYYTENDDGGNWGVVTSGVHTDDGGSVFTLADGQYVAANLEGDKISVKKFGAVGDDTSTDDPFINNALATGLNIYAPSGTYKCTNTLEVIGNFSGDGVSTLFKFYAATLAQAINKTAEGDLSDFSVDAANVTNCAIGIRIEADYDPDREVYSNLVVTNITEATRATYGILLVRGGAVTSVRGNFFFDKCVVKDVNGSVTAARGIIVSFNNESQANLAITNCVVQNVTPKDEGDLIFIVTAAHKIEAKDDYSAFISNNHLSSNVEAKRGFKIQWHNAKVVNNTVIGDNIILGYDTYAFGSVFYGNTYVSDALNGEAYNAYDAKRTIIANSNIRMNTVAQCIRISGDSDLKIINTTIDYEGTPTGDTLGIIQVNDSSNVDIANLTMNVAAQAGCGILQDGTSTVRMTNSTISGPKYGHRCNFGSGTFKMSGQTIFTGVLFGTQAFGTNGFTYDISDSYINAGTTALYNQSTGNLALTNVRNTELLVGTNGVLGSSNDVITDCTITNTGVQAGVGVITGTNGRVSNNIITNFTTGLQYNFTTNTIINSNTTIDCATAIVKTGTVDFVFYENNDR